MASFMITPVEKGIMRCQHTGPYSHEDVRSMASFFNDYRGKLLIDLRGSTGEECARHLQNFRSMMPTAAVFGATIDPSILDLPESYCAKEVRYFEDEPEALKWLRDQ